MTAPDSAHSCNPHSSALPALALASPIASLRTTLATWQARRRYRKDLARLLKVGTYMIRDVGLKPEEALREIGKPFWEA
jgi:uncharacterized protein YjiS (DUF1127 family)